ncbi:YfbR-like 5'-deoxynucleotidase [Pasteurella multocida]|uniref:YfbR-like 5'-deoxynucleotidase n=1 Tax=Pasteurella multocida TaxID=747 RepID=UPI003979C2F3
MAIYLTHSNRVINFQEPGKSDIHIDDIVHHLSMIPRFGGKLDRHYSVLDHSVYVGMIAKTFLKADDETAFAALMHDAQEAFLGDIPSPLKSLLPDYKAIEKSFEKVIQEKFNISMSETIKDLVKYADLLALKAEKEAFINTPIEQECHWQYLHELPLVPISPIDFCVNSKELFFQAFDYYRKNRE